jgi:hypothetical protein
LLPYLGSFESLPAMVAALQRQLAPAATTSGAGHQPVSACAAGAAAHAGLPPGTQPELEADLTFQGTPSMVLVFHRAGGGGRVAVIVRADSCAPLATTSF